MLLTMRHVELNHSPDMVVVVVVGGGGGGCYNFSHHASPYVYFR
jgi:hypothetical protein